MLLTNASGFPFCPMGDTLCGCPHFRHTEFHSKGPAMKISLRSVIFYLRVTVETTVILRGSDPKNICTSCRQAQHSPVPATRLKLCFQLEIALRNEQQQPWQLYGPFGLRLLACQHQSYFMVLVHIGKYLIRVPEWQPGNSITGRKIFLL